MALVHKIKNERQGCQDNAGTENMLQFEAIGTQWQIQIYDQKDELEIDNLKNKIQKKLHNFETTYSRFKHNSLISKMSRKAGTFTFPESARPLFSLYQKLYTATEGLVTPLIGSMMEDTGYDKLYTLKPKKKIRNIPKMEEVMRIDEVKIKIKQPLSLDFGAIGKGYCIDIIGETIQNSGIKNYTIDAGGDIRTRNVTGKPLTIGLENPDNLSQIIGTVELRNQSICASSGSRRKWGTYHHIMNPKTKKSQEIIKATWVIADTTLLADAIATALFFVPPAKVAHIGAFKYIILTKKNELFYSTDINIDF